MTVTDVHPHAIDCTFDRRLEPRIVHGIGVPGDGVHGRDCRQLLEDALADVAGMQDELHTVERRKYVSPNESVRVGDEADEPYH